MENILKRRSIRQYTSEPVGEEQIEQILRAAMSAPSAGNQQPWHFVVITDRALLDRIPEIHPHARMVAQAPVAVAVCGDLSLEKHDGMWLQDCSAATQNLLLAVQALGLGAVWLGVYPREPRMEGLRRLLRLPKQVVPLALVPIGHPAEEKPPVDRFQPDRVHYNGW